VRVACDQVTQAAVDQLPCGCSDISSATPDEARGDDLDERAALPEVLQIFEMSSERPAPLRVREDGYEAEAKYPLSGSRQKGLRRVLLNLDQEELLGDRSREELFIRSGDGKSGADLGCEVEIEVDASLGKRCPELLETHKRVIVARWIPS
jgi:hypothetical protein